jgi:acetyltransferase-like isoleucine patch superfamily enzyme
MIVQNLRQLILKALVLRNTKVVFKQNSRIDKKSAFMGGNVLYENSKVVDSIIGYGTYLAEGSYIQSASIGKYCSIGPNVLFAIGTHPTRTFVSTHPAFFSTKKQSGFSYAKSVMFCEDEKFADFNGKSIFIGNDVWIGASVTVLPGVSIGDGAIIAAGTTVYKNVEPYAVVAGSPMKVLRKRFSEHHCELLNEIQWWNWDSEKLRANVADFADISLFISKYVV